MADPKNFTWEPPDKNISIADAKSLFLVAIEKVAPEVIEELHEKIFPYFKLNYYEIGESDSLESKIEPFTEKLGQKVLLAKDIKALLSWSSFKNASEDFYPDLLSIKTRIENWIVKFFLHSGDDWMQEQALETMGLWALLRDNKSIRKEWGFYPGGNYISNQEPLIIELPKLYDTEMTRPQIQKKYERFCRKQIIEYLDEREEERLDQGWQVRYRKTNTEHFEWLCYYQIKGLSKGILQKRYRD